MGVVPVYGAEETSSAVQAPHDYTNCVPAYTYKLVIVGGGSGGMTMANKFASKLGKNQVAVIEPSHVHYYQPYFTLVGGGIKKLCHGGSHKEMSEVLDKNAIWIHDKAVEFQPEANQVLTASGRAVSYDFLVVAMGIQTNFDAVDGLLEALEQDPQVCSNYHAKYVSKTYPAIRNFEKGNAIFTFPNTPVKCAGAPQKIMYLTDWRLTQMKKRHLATIMYNTSLPVVFGVKKYAAELTKVMQSRHLELNTRLNLIRVDHRRREAVFEHLPSPSSPSSSSSSSSSSNDDNQHQLTSSVFKYDLLHVCPPQSAPEVIRRSRLADPLTGFLQVDKYSLQHVKYGNVFGIGDCTNVPTSKTAAAVASQSKTLRKNLDLALKGKLDKLGKTYDGYTSCPLVIGYDKCILAEFDFDGNPMETFPVDQGQPRTSMYLMKSELMPVIYWQGLVKGYWEGPSFFRNTMKALRLK
ncbi:unnamed protein product [Notodromas monacha]|uniref:Sulfide:quinone oxidoreductase, mitochondrial n=1 Tax=Notodromas monacha TaxID=399045 RepID=A0A7R9G9R3_9CRUS|nr:unnamed protein product [Notodromas monacha]CAG0914542.1 unnamed protein product [Notodromas monacha]